MWRRAIFAACLSAAPAWSSTALLVAPTTGTEERARVLRASLRQELTQVPPSSGALIAEELQLVRLRGPAGAALDLGAVQTLLRTAEEAFVALDHERSVTLLETAIGHLEADRDFSTEKRALLETARISCAQRLVGLAGPAETGKGDTQNGKRARAHLAAVLRSQPTFTLDPQRYAPKLRALLALAGEDVKRAGFGDLQVVSKPAGVKVVVDGRLLGQTPLVLHAGVPAGRFRLWVEDGAVRSFARVIEVRPGDVVRTEIDLGFEGAIRPDTAAITPLRTLQTPDWQRLAGMLDVEAIAVVGIEDGPDQSRVWAALIDGRSGVVVRGAFVPVGGEATLLAMLRGAPGQTDFLLPVRLQDPPPPVVEAESSSSPWLALGVGVGGAVLVGAAVGAVLLLTPTPQPTFSVAVVEGP
jgi:hypothetical protein